MAGLVAMALASMFVATAQAQPREAVPASPATVALPAGLSALLEQSRRMLAGGEARRAYEALKEAEPRYAGFPEFDYLLGLAAIDTGNPGQAILALERVLAVRPTHLQARAEIARAYLLAREPESARKEFETVAARPIPPEVRRVIDTYLRALAQPAPGPEARTQFYVETSLGWDSNANFGSALGQWLLADGTAVTPQAVSQPRNSALSAVGLGFFVSRPISGAWEWTAGANLSHRGYPSAHTLDQTYFDVQAGLNRKGICHFLTMQAQLQHLRLDNATFRNAAGLFGQWRCDLNRTQQLGAFVQSFQFTFPGQTVRDAQRHTLGLTFAQVLPGSSGAVLVSSLYAGKETPRSGLGQLEFRFAGLRVALNTKLGQGWRGYVAASHETRDFAAPEPLFGTTRADRQLEFRLGAEKEFGRNWVISPQIIHTNNGSSVAPNDFRRTQVLVTARYQWQ